MDTATTQTLHYRPAPLRDDDDKFVALATQMGEQFAPRAAEHDRDNTFVTENFEKLHESGYTRMAVPVSLGGMGATMRQVCYAQAELAKYCASTALAVNMHIYLTLANVFRWEHGAAAAEGVLRRVASEGIILMTSGGSDWIYPSGTAVREDGGYRVSGRKSFCSQAPVANVLTTAAVYNDPNEGPVVLAISVPTNSPGFKIVETWDTMGMRGTSSHDIQMDDIFVSEAQVVAKRPWGKIDPVLRNAVIHIAPTAASVYYGVAAGARDEAVRTVMQRKRGDGTPLAQDPIIQRQVGLMEYKLHTSWWSLMGSIDELGDHYGPDERSTNLVNLAKRQVVSDAVEIVDIAMETVGGAAFFKKMPLERAYRDVRAGKFHPLNTEATLLYAGRLTLGQSVDIL